MCLFSFIENELVLVLWIKPIYISKGKDINNFCLTIQVEAENQSPASSISPFPSPKRCCASSSYAFHLGEIWENHGWKKMLILWMSVITHRAVSVLINYKHMIIYLVAVVQKKSLGCHLKAMHVKRITKRHLFVILKYGTLDNGK